MSKRHYGLNLLDKVEINRFGKIIRGYVSKFDCLDNNRCYILYKRVLIGATCEECKKVKSQQLQFDKGEMMKKAYEPKTPEQKLGYLVEECGETLAAIGKTIRWGLDSFNPELSLADQELNRDWVRRELADLKEAIALVEDIL